MKEYCVETYTTSFFSGTLKPDVLQARMNIKAAEGWKFVRSIQEHKRVLLLFSREAHFLIFERDAVEPAEIVLLRQLLRAYGHEPEA
jgi:hypothetical protein